MEYKKLHIGTTDGSGCPIPTVKSPSILAFCVTIICSAFAKVVHHHKFLVESSPSTQRKEFRSRVEVSLEEGTVWWHAHYGWARATVHGAIIVFPMLGTKYPFPKPDAEFPLDYLMITPGQSMEVLLEANQSPGNYFIAATAYADAVGAGFDKLIGDSNSFLQYRGSDHFLRSPLPNLPPYNRTKTATDFTKQFRPG
ncbi:hypothetical protein REPUB_Repub04eG0103300 [Reevesia pubescens]